MKRKNGKRKIAIAVICFALLTACGKKTDGYVLDTSDLDPVNVPTPQPTEAVEEDPGMTQDSDGSQDLTGPDAVESDLPQLNIVEAEEMENLLAAAEADAVVFRTNDGWDFLTVLWEPETGRISLAKEDMQYFPRSAFSKTDGTTMYYDEESDPGQYDIYNGEELIAENVVFPLLEDAGYQEENYYCETIDLYTDEEQELVRILCDYRNETEKEAGYVIIDVPFSDPQNQKVNFYILWEGDSFDESPETADFSIFMLESVITPNAIYGNGWPGICQYDLATGELKIWEEQRIELDEYGSEKYGDISHQMTPLGFSQGYFLGQTNFGMTDIGPSAMVYAIYNEAGELQNFAVME